MPVSPAYTSVSFYTRFDVAYYAINDRAAGRRIIELDLMTAEQHNEMPEDEDITAADRLIVESPTPTGLIAIRALAPEPGLDAGGAGGARRRPLRAAGFGPRLRAVNRRYRRAAAAGQRQGGSVAIFDRPQID